ncbi:MAG: glutamine synthetase III, partial [Actinobacteria bacterium]|nr:glutamine synthetase III [Actinomycetota bacterium]
MSGSTARLHAIDAVKGHQPPGEIFSTSDAPGAIFGSNVFTKADMQKRLPKAVYQSLLATIERSRPLDPLVADIVASAARIGMTGHFGKGRSRVRGLPETAGELPIAALAEEIETPGTGAPRALLTIAGNPALSAPNGGRL